MLAFSKPGLVNEPGGLEPDDSATYGFTFTNKFPKGIVLTDVVAAFDYPDGVTGPAKKKLASSLAAGQSGTENITVKTKAVAPGAYAIGVAASFKLVASDGSTVNDKFPLTVSQD